MRRNLAADASVCDPDGEARLVRRVAAAVEGGRGPGAESRNCWNSGPLRRRTWILAAAAGIAGAALMITFLMHDDAMVNPAPAEDPAVAFEKLAEITQDLFDSVDPPPAEPATWLSAVAQPLTEEAGRLSADAAMVGSFLQTFLAVEIIRSRSEPDRDD
jgi:hypothetical protein